MAAYFSDLAQPAPENEPIFSFIQRIVGGPADAPPVGVPLTDGWIEWHGGENPVPGQWIEFRIRGFKRPGTGRELSDEMDWRHWSATPASDIIAYRPVPAPSAAPSDRAGAQLSRDLNCLEAALSAALAEPAAFEAALNEFLRWYRLNETTIAKGLKPSDSEIDFEVEAHSRMKRALVALTGRPVTLEAGHG